MKPCPRCEGTRLVLHPSVTGTMPCPRCNPEGLARRAKSNRWERVHKWTTPEEARAEGRAAKARGKACAECPYAAGDEAHLFAAWREGFAEGRAMT